MDHGPNIKVEEKEEVVEYKTKLGLKLFGIYAVVYFAFVFLNTFAPKLMSTRILFNLNLAIFYGFSLIILAVVMGLIYNSACTKKENASESDKKKEGAK